MPWEHDRGGILVSILHAFTVSHGNNERTFYTLKFGNSVEPMKGYLTICTWVEVGSKITFFFAYLFVIRKR